MTTSNAGSAVSSQQGMGRSEATDPDAQWKTLYKIGGVAALLTAAIIPFQGGVFIASPPPTTVKDYFELFQRNPLLGLVDLDLLLIVDNVLLIPLFLALYVAIRRVDESWMAIGTTIGLIGLVALFASNPAFGMLNLSDQYAAATTEAQRAGALGGGEAMLAMYNGTAFKISYVLGSLAGIVVSAVMVRSGVFSRLTGHLGIFSNVVGFGLFVPVIGVYISLLSVLPLLFWYLLAGLKLLRMGRAGA